MVFATFMNITKTISGTHFLLNQFNKSHLCPKAAASREAEDNWLGRTPCWRGSRRPRPGWVRWRHRKWGSSSSAAHWKALPPSVGICDPLPRFREHALPADTCDAILRNLTQFYAIWRNFTQFYAILRNFTQLYARASARTRSYKNIFRVDLRYAEIWAFSLAD